MSDFPWFLPPFSRERQSENFLRQAAYQVYGWQIQIVENRNFNMFRSSLLLYFMCVRAFVRRSPMNWFCVLFFPFSKSRAPTMLDKWRYCKSITSNHGNAQIGEERMNFGSACWCDTSDAHERQQEALSAADRKFLFQNPWAELKLLPDNVEKSKIE